MPARVWGRMNRYLTGQWCDAKAGFWGKAIKGSSSLQAALTTLMLDEVSAVRGDAEVATLFLDIMKIYDHVDISLLCVLATKLGFSPV
eukprot:3199554-Pyramimonas_sp.AAC.1